MSDNPLADWLGDDHDGESDPGPGPPERPGDSAPARWPDWAGSATAPRDPQPATWAQPPAEDTEARSPRRRLLLLAAALPWAVACALGVAVVASDPPATDESTVPVASADRHPALVEPAAAGEPALGAAAALAVRLTATTAAEEEDPTAGRRYVDLAVPEALSWAGDVAIVTVAAVVLEGAGDQWHTSRPARFAVPLQVVDGRAVALGPPWPLTADTPTGDLQWERADADHDGVARALSAAGYTDIDALDVEKRAGSSPPDQVTLLRAHVQAAAPGESHPRAHQLWLRTDPEPTVLGADRPTAEGGRP